MRRRQALSTLSALGALGAVALPGVRAAADGPDAAASAPALAWGLDGAWLATADGAWPLPAAVAPAAVSRGVWTTSADGLVQRWPAGADRAGPWAPVAVHALGEPAHALAASPDGRHAAVAHGRRLTLLDASARPLKVLEGADLARTRRGSAAALWAHAGRRSFVAAWPALGELWEIPLDPDAPPIHEGLVHDYRSGEALPSPGYLGVRRAPLDRPMPRFGVVDARVPWVAGIADDGVAVVHLDVRRRIATLPLAQARLHAAALRAIDGRLQWWLPAGDAVHVVDTVRWVVRETWPVPPGLRVLRAIGATVWALGQGGVWRWARGAWQRLDGGPAGIDHGTALAIDTERGHWLLAGTDPAVLWRLDGDGRPLARLVVPEGVVIDGVAAIPP